MSRKGFFIKEDVQMEERKIVCCPFLGETFYMIYCYRDNCTWHTCPANKNKGELNEKRKKS